MMVKRGLGTFSRLGVEKLVVIPLLLHMLSAEEIGNVVLALGWGRLLLSFPAHGASDGLMRLHAAAHDKGEWPALMRAGLLLCSVIMIGVGGVVLVGALIGGQRETNPDLLFYGIPMGVVCILEGMRAIATTPLRIDLKFGTMGVIEAAVGVLMLLSIPLALLFGVAGLLGGYLISALITLLITTWLIRGVILSSQGSMKRWFIPLVSTSGIFALTSGFASATQQAGRLALGFFESADTVTVFYAAEAVIMAMSVPITYVSGILYTLIARKSSMHTVSRKTMVQHMCGSLVGAGLFLIIAHIAGIWLLYRLYPSVAAEAEPVFRVKVWGAAFIVLYLLTRGFVYRFSRLRSITLMSAINLLCVGGGVLILTPLYGLMGAAWGVTIGNVLLGLLWFGVYVTKYVFGQPPTVQVLGVGQPDNATS
ncbi:MAG: hypothetical protein GXY38_07855 [Planctomycetes bacterium]|nr:hypothetical protein [Planctomycetota bacterium]